MLYYISLQKQALQGAELSELRKECLAAGISVLKWTFRSIALTDWLTLHVWQRAGKGVCVWRFVRDVLTQMCLELISYSSHSVCQLVHSNEPCISCKSLLVSSLREIFVTCILYTSQPPNIGRAGYMGANLCGETVHGIWYWDVMNFQDFKRLGHGSWNFVQFSVHAFDVEAVCCGGPFGLGR